MEQRKEPDNGGGQSSFRRKVARLYFKKAVFHQLPKLFSGFLQQALLGCQKYFPGLLYWHSIALAGNHRGLSGPPRLKKIKFYLKDTNILQK